MEPSTATLLCWSTLIEMLKQYYRKNIDIKAGGLQSDTKLP